MSRSVLAPPPAATAVGVFAVAAAIACPGPAHAQSASDGFNPGVNGPVLSLAVQPDGKVLVGGSFTGIGGADADFFARSNIARLFPSGLVEGTWDPGTNGEVDALVVQPDGKILVAGQFTMLGGGGTGTTPRAGLGRLNADGTLDTSFNPGVNGAVFTVALQSTGQIIVAGAFTTIGGGGTGNTPRNYIARLNPDGSVDPAFDPGADAPLGCTLQPDDKIILRGQFTMVGGGGTGNSPRHFMARLDADGSVDAGFDPGTDGAVATEAVQPDGRIVVGGAFTMIGGGGTGNTPRLMIARLNPDGTVDSGFNPGISGPSDPSTGVRTVAIQADGKILVGGSFTGIGGGTGTTPRNSIARLNPDGTTDLAFTFQPNNPVDTIVVQSDRKILVGGTFNMFGTSQRLAIARLQPTDGYPESGFNPGTNGSVYAIALQPDLQMIVGGAFTAIGGKSATVPRQHLARITQDHAIDSVFAPGANDVVITVAVQTDGKILVGGLFTGLGGGTGTTPRSHIGRLNADGSLDASFDPGANGSVTALAVQPDGKILVGGDFTMIGGGGTGATGRSRLARLSPDGTVDTTFDPGADAAVETLTVEDTGQILVGGSFSMLGGGGTGGTARSHLGRLNADGSLDASFDPGANDVVLALAEQADGRILVGGNFSALGGGTGSTARQFVGRLNADGSLDNGFNPGADNSVEVLAVQPNGEILLAGSFTALGGGSATTPRNRIGRLLADGTVDTAFDPGANAKVGAGALTADGKFLVGGDFTTLGGGGTGTVERNYIGELFTNEVVTQAITITSAGSVVTWSRSGAGPELSSVAFESSADGSSYAPLGPASRVNGGWQLTGQSLPANQSTFVRARGHFATGFQNASGSLLEEIVDVFPTPPTSTLVHTPSKLNFGAAKNGADGALVSVTPAQSVTINYTGAAPAWTATTTTPWLSIAGGSGTGLGSISVSIVNPNNVIGGSTSLVGSITFNAPTAAPVTLTVTLTIDLNDTISTPIGQVDTPAQNATGVRSAIALTGWSLDTIGVASLDVYRNCFPFDNPASCQVIGADNVVYVGSGNFIAGARPDVEAAFPNYPEANRAGWGLLVLTNFLPHVPDQLVFGGQGTITLFVYATNVQGQRTLLGRTQSDSTPTSITLDNDHLAVPFGNIDVPSQSGTASGVASLFGWTLTPDADTQQGNGDVLVPLDGSTIQVLIDGVSVGTMAYNQCRGDVGNPPPAGVFCDDDVASAFGNPTPQPTLTPRGSNPTKFRNLDAGRGAIGSFVLDTTSLTDGQHTIVLQVIDSDGRVAGVGSRYFTVLNGGGSEPSAAMLDALVAAPGKTRGLASSLDRWPLSDRLIGVRTGFNPATAATQAARSASGTRTVSVPAAGSLELSLGAPVEIGYLMANGELRDLPVGSHLDRATGVFTWTPPPGYFGTYHLVFILASQRVLVDVTVGGLE